VLRRQLVTGPGEEVSEPGDVRIPAGVAQVGGGLGGAVEGVREPGQHNTKDESMIHPSRTAVAVLLLLGLAACSGGGGHSASSQGGFKPVSNDRGDLSSKFPMPSDITGMQSSSVDGRTYVNMHLKNGPADYDFWTSKLRQAGRDDHRGKSN
jgi:hypothetical protein